MCCTPGNGVRASKEGVCPSVLGGATGIRTQISELATALQLRNPLRNRGKSGVSRGLTILVLRVKMLLFDPFRPPLKGFESLRFRQSTSKHAPSGAFLFSTHHLPANRLPLGFHLDFLPTPPKLSGHYPVRWPPDRGSNCSRGVGASNSPSLGPTVQTLRGLWAGHQVNKR